MTFFTIHISSRVSMFSDYNTKQFSSHKQILYLCLPYRLSNKQDPYFLSYSLLSSFTSRSWGDILRLRHRCEIVCVLQVFSTAGR